MHSQGANGPLWVSEVSNFGSNHGGQETGVIFWELFLGCSQLPTVHFAYRALACEHCVNFGWAAVSQKNAQAKDVPDEVVRT